MKKGWSVLFVLSVLGIQHLVAAPEDEVKGVLERYIRAAQARLLHDGQDIANPLGEFLIVMDPAQHHTIPTARCAMIAPVKPTSGGASSPFDLPAFSLEWRIG
jgi:hypothetical protein